MNFIVCRLDLNKQPKLNLAIYSQFAHMVSLSLSRALCGEGHQCLPGSVYKGVHTVFHLISISRGRNKHGAQSPT